MTITNLDPKPWEREGVRCDFLRMQSGWVRDPRPEFDVRGNPLLEIFAEYNDGTEPVAVLAERFLAEHERYVELSSIPERQYAEEVLERIIEASA